MTEGPEAGKSFDFVEADTFLVGRSPKAHLRFDRKADNRVSRTHCLLDIRPPKCILTDLGSTNGTYVNDKRIRRAELKDGDIIRVGKSRLAIHIESRNGGKPAPVLCAVCRKDVNQEIGDVPPEEREFLVYTCRACEKKEAAARKQKQLKRRKRSEKPSPRYSCMYCEADLTAQANADGRAAELVHASYICPKCAVGVRQMPLDVNYIGNFAVLRVLGEGGMGIVYKAVHEPTTRVYAVKKILPDLIMDERTCRLFEREMNVQSKIIHPNLVKLLEIGRCEMTPYCVTEFLARGGHKESGNQGPWGPHRSGAGLWSNHSGSEGPQGSPRERIYTQGSQTRKLPFEPSPHRQKLPGQDL